ncbi:DUF2185 domain-containing protein [Acidothermaceae bacterium B102]|nr:DUF2185 domain-containing protein [Acidothermaceae bacterium B102]
MDERAVGFTLEDAEALHALRPRSFFIPTRAERESLTPGDVAKLLFAVVAPAEGMPAGERMWVEVTEVTAGGYRGVLANPPSVITTIALDDPVEFGPEHVISLRESWPLLGKRIFVSRRSHEDDLRPGWVYREQPDDDEDSGWRAMVGDETDEEVDAPESILLQNVGYFLDRWPDLRSLFRAEPLEGGWAWDGEALAYVPVVEDPA